MRERDISRQAGRIIGNGRRRSRAPELLLPMGPAEIGSPDPMPDHTVTYRRARDCRQPPSRRGHGPRENAGPSRRTKNQQPRIKQQPTIKENGL